MIKRIKKSCAFIDVHLAGWKPSALHMAMRFTWPCPQMRMEEDFLRFF